MTDNDQGSNNNNNNINCSSGSSSSTSYTPLEFSKWDEIDINPLLLRGLYAYGFDMPSVIQQKSVLSLFDKKDMIAQAQSGTGKTGAFTVGVLQSVDTSKDVVQSLILAPTRELAKQIVDVISNIGTFMSVRIQLLVGGTSTDDDISDFKTQKPQIVVGCPGRVYDLLRRRVLQAKDIRIMILDEADEMLSVGFKDQVYNIFQYLNTTVQVGLFSATMSEEMHSLSEKFLRNPVKILVKADALTLEGIVQYYVALEDDAHKYDTLKDIYKIVAMSQCIIYCNSIKRVVDLTDAMQRDDFPVCCIHSGMDKKDRDVAFTEFKQGKHRVLISSNVTARGIDVQNVGIVINFDVPHDIHTYLHRIGRSGRWGRKGKAINFITRWDLKKIKEIEVYYQTSITELPGNFNID